MSSQVVQGICDGDNAFFLVNAVSAVVVGAVLQYVTHLKTRSPDPSKVNFGMPFIVLELLLSISFWVMASNSLFFILFFFAFPAVFPLNTKMACISISGLPILSAFFCLQCAILAVSYNPKKVLEDVRRVVVDDDLNAFERGGGSRRQRDDDEQQPLNVACIGTMSRGMYFLERVKRERSEKVPTSISTAVVYGDSFDVSHLENNAMVMGVALDRSELRFVRAAMPRNDSGSPPYTIPLPSNSVDRAIISPFFRSSPVVGPFIGGEESKNETMQQILIEVLRITKPNNGRIICYDAAQSILFVAADLKELLPGSCVTTVEECAPIGAVSCFQSPGFLLTATKPEGWTAPQQGTTKDSTAVEVTQSDRQLQQETAQLLHHDPKPSGGVAPHWLVATILAFQFVVYVGLCFGAAALYRPTNVPTSLPLGQRANNLMVGAATGYPLMAFFSRTILVGKILAREIAFPSVFGFLWFEIKTELLAIAATFLFSVVFGLPTFLLYLALHSSGVADEPLSFIGIGISLVVAIVSYKRGRTKMTVDQFKARNIDLKYVKLLGL